MKHFFLLLSIMAGYIPVHATPISRTASCASLNPTTLQLDQASTLTFEIDSNDSLQNVKHSDLNGTVIDDVQNQIYGKPNPGYENEPLVLFPWQNNRITTGNSYLGKFCQNSRSSNYYNRWIFIDRAFLDGSKISAYLLLFVSDEAQNAVHSDVFFCQSK